MSAASFSAAALASASAFSAAALSAASFSAASFFSRSSLNCFHSAKSLAPFLQPVLHELSSVPHCAAHS